METHKCNKEGKIDSMDRKLNELGKVVHKSTNGDSLLAIGRNTSKAVQDMGVDIRTLLTFQTVTETRREIEDESRDKKIKKQQVLIAAIGLALGSGLTILGMILAMSVQ